MRTKNQALNLLAKRGYSPSVVVDVGVAKGTDGLYNVWPDAHYVLIEALPKFQEDLERIAEQLGSCEIINAFAGRTFGSAQVATDPNQDHVHIAAELAPSHWERAVVPILTVDSVVIPNIAASINRSVLLKIDVDGAEIDVLEGSRATLTYDCAVVIEAALLDEPVSRFGKIVNFMVAHGYEVLDILEPMLRPGDQFVWQVDLLFVPRHSVMRSSKFYFNSIPEV